MVTVGALTRLPDRAGFDSPQGAVVAVREHDPGIGGAFVGKRRGPRIVFGDKMLTPSEAAQYRDAISAALDWLEEASREVDRLNGADDEHPGVPEPCRTDRCRLDEGHDGAHAFYAVASDDPWAPAGAR